MDWILRTEFWVTFITLTGLEIILGIDNVIFHSLTISRLPLEYQQKARVAGMSLAVLMRFVLLAGIFWFVGISKSLLVVAGQEISTRDLVLIYGGLFLVIKSCFELCSPAVEKSHRKSDAKKIPGKSGFIGCIIQIVILDIVFSLDSVITAVGMVNDMRAIMLAIVVSVIVMMFCTNAVGKYLQSHNRIRMLAFSFIALVGAVLVAEGFDVVVPKSHVYAAGVFALVIEYGIGFVSKKRKGKRIGAAVSVAMASSTAAAVEAGSNAAASIAESVKAAPSRLSRFSCASTPFAAPVPESEGNVVASLNDAEAKSCLGSGLSVEYYNRLGWVELDLGIVDYLPLSSK